MWSRVATADDILRTASSSVVAPCSRTYLPRTRVNVPYARGCVRAPSLNRVGAARVCAELDPRLSDLKGDVLLAHHEEDRANSPALGEHQVERGIDPILALVFGDVVQVPATVLPILNRTESEEEGALGRRERAEILPPPTVSGSL